MQELPSPSHTPQSSILPLLQQRPAAFNAPLHSLAQYISKKQRVIGIVTDCRWRGSVPLGGSGRGCRSLDSNVHLVRQPRLELDSSCRVYQGHQTHSISDDDPERRSNLPSVDSTLLCTPCSTCKRHSYTLPSLENPILLSVLNTGVCLSIEWICRSRRDVDCSLRSWTVCSWGTRRPLPALQSRRHIERLSSSSLITVYKENCVIDLA